MRSASAAQAAPPVLYRFSKPKDEPFPAMLEIFSRLPEGIALAEHQTIFPVPTGANSPSLSAIQVDADSHALICQQRETRDGLAFASATALIPLKAKAWLDLSARSKLAGQTVDARDIAKHRTDVFPLAATLAGDTTAALPKPIRADLAAFLAAFPEGSSEWPAILGAIKNTVGGNLKPAAPPTLFSTFLLPSLLFRCARKTSTNVIANLMVSYTVKHQLLASKNATLHHP